MKSDKISNIISIIFVIFLIILFFLQLFIVIFSDIHYLIRIAIALIAAFFIGAIAFLIVERKREPPIKY